ARPAHACLGPRHDRRGHLPPDGSEAEAAAVLVSRSRTDGGFAEPSEERLPTTTSAAGKICEPNVPNSTGGIAPSPGIGIMPSAISARLSVASLPRSGARAAVSRTCCALMVLLAMTGCQGGVGPIARWRMAKDGSLAQGPTREELGDNRSMMARWLS